MKILHTSDLHLDSPLTTRLDSKKVKERKSELLLSFKNLAEQAKKERAEGFIISGDLFDSEKIGKRTLRNVVDIITAYPDITFFYLTGNHEKDVLEKSMLPLPKNLRLFNDGWTYFKLGNVNVIGRCSTSKDMFAELNLNENERNILVLHGELRDRSDSGGIIGKKDAENLAVDYMALGHYHSYSKNEVSERCTAVYSGTPEGRGFDEIGDCGFVMIEADEKEVRHRFIKSALRTLHIEEIDVTDVESDVALLYKIESRLRTVPRADLVRIVLIGSRRLGKSFNTDAALASLGKAYYYIEIKDITRVKISPEEFKNDISLKGEFIRSVLDDGTLTDEEKEKVIMLGLEVLIEEVN